MASISPEHWHFLPFGTNIDPYGGKRTPLERMEIKPLLITEETSKGLLQMRYVDGKFNVLAIDLGIGLLYDRSGLLESAGIDIVQYCDNLDKEDLEKIGGDEMIEMLGTMLINGDRLYLSVELKDKTVAIANINEYSGGREILFSATNVDFYRRNLLTLSYYDYTMFIGLSCLDDEFEIGAIVKRGADASFEQKMRLLSTIICSDCNFKTYLEGGNKDRFDRLARRIFN